MKTETRLFWKFFFEQKISEIWGMIKMIPTAAIAATILVGIVIGIIAISGILSWSVFHFCHWLPSRLDKLSVDNIFAFGISAIVVVGISAIIVTSIYRWIHSNVEKARLRVKLQMKIKERV